MEKSTRRPATWMATAPRKSCSAWAPTSTTGDGWRCEKTREVATPTSSGSGSPSVPITRPMGPPGQPRVMWMETTGTRFCSGSGPSQRTAAGSSSEKMRQVGSRTPPGATWTTAPRERPDRRQSGHPKGPSRNNLCRSGRRCIPARHPVRHTYSVTGPNLSPQRSS